MLGTQKMLREHLLMVPFAVDLGLGSPFLDCESRTVPWYTQVTEYWQPLAPKDYSEEPLMSPRMELRVQLHLSPLSHCCD